MKGLEMIKCESLGINMYRITHTGKSVNFPVTVVTLVMADIRGRLVTYSHCSLVKWENVLLVKILILLPYNEL